MLTYIKNWFYEIYIRWVSEACRSKIARHDLRASDIENQLDSDTSRSLSEDGVLELIRAINRE
jgi:hypothetical protein